MELTGLCTYLIYMSAWSYLSADLSPTSGPTKSTHGTSRTAMKLTDLSGASPSRSPTLSSHVSRNELSQIKAPLNVTRCASVRDRAKQARAVIGAVTAGRLIIRTEGLRVYLLHRMYTAAPGHTTKLGDTPEKGTNIASVEAASKHRRKIVTDVTSNYYRQRTGASKVGGSTAMLMSRTGTL
ncbi:hypothetical protein GGR52DRAFT_556287 [Hypoxylon sp. FL1284]|nr:hypothetical protein GGR52DRAFT_556287 [Hypoxylon sp. FL1284]